ncbi:MAG: 50S ribosomal protein L13 [Parcubacteria group bacterium]|jgi:large subunit ribosomal protein L13|nr:50S ribosomal protein L13 [Parcubacteria group bacterium]|tara:strand:- start:13512 stop:13961 length:450 start_codon:yes stop_codon:yes gene_type:complete
MAEHKKSTTKNIEKAIKDSSQKAKKKKVSKKPVIDRQTHKIDAKGKILGRLSTEVAQILRGKNKPSFLPHVDGGDFVVISNASQIKTTGKKMEQKVYYHYSGYPGGLKEKKMSKVFEKDPGEIIKRAVWNMLPKNKLRTSMIKRLIVKN